MQSDSLINIVHILNFLVLKGSLLSLTNNKTKKHGTFYQTDIQSSFILPKESNKLYCCAGSPALSPHYSPRLTKALYCQCIGVHIGNVCIHMHLGYFFPFVFSSSIWSLAGALFGPTEISRPPAHVFERHLFILKMQMWPASKTDRHEMTHCARGEVSILETCPSLYHTEIAVRTT